MEAQGLDATPSTPAELGQLVKIELVKWAKLIKRRGDQARMSVATADHLERYPHATGEGFA